MLLLVLNCCLNRASFVVCLFADLALYCSCGRVFELIVIVVFVVVVWVLGDCLGLY